VEETSDLEQQRSMTEEAGLDKPKWHDVAVDGLLQLADVCVAVTAR